MEWRALRRRSGTRDGRARGREIDDSVTEARGQENVRDTDASEGARTREMARQGVAHEARSIANSWLALVVMEGGLHRRIDVEIAKNRKRR